MTISNATIRNNFADGVNFAQGTSNSTVINSNIRGNGDDGLATWSSHHENTNAHVAENNHFLNNTVELGWRAAGIGIFGGKGHEVANNLIKDNANWGGVRLNTVFKNSHNFDFNDTGISVHDNLLVNNGTNADTYGRVKGSIDLEEGRDYATPKKDILGELNNIKIENNTIVNNLSDQEITKTRNPKEGNIPEPANETTLTIENNHSLSVAENTSAKNVAEVDDHSLTQAANHLGADNIITITDSSHALVSGGDGNDRIRGGLGHDMINGDSGNDIISGYDGDDRLNGGMGNDSIYGENGNDTLWGESGNDRLNGGDGNDVLFGGQGTDYLVGGKGADTYVFSLGEGKDTIVDNVGEHNALQFGQNISVNDLHIDAITDVRGNIDWKITIKGSEGDSITINDQFVSGNTNDAVIDTFRFDKGTLSLQELMGRLSGNGNINNLSAVNTHTERMSYSSVDTANVHDDTASTANAGII
ncbi:calcium-binding protein [Neisseria flavescens]|uniref:calcium-binding protein n=1 Tax=Neisseria flavescens TaxID=484 RepID=UPI000ADB7558|nr:calcium-binding protein [Neisseria flavescens]